MKKKEIPAQYKYPPFQTDVLFKLNLFFLLKVWTYFLYYSNLSIKRMTALYNSYAEKGFKKGMVLRIQMHNFLTYDDAEVPF